MCLFFLVVVDDVVTAHFLLGTTSQGCSSTLDREGPRNGEHLLLWLNQETEWICPSASVRQRFRYDQVP